MHVQSLSEYIQHFESLSYVGVFLAVFFSGHIVPLPEDVILPLVGYIAALGIVKYWLATTISIVSIICADSVLYALSYVGAKIAVAFKERIKAQLFNWYVDKMTTHTFQTMFVSRFVPGLRVVNPIVAGFLKVKPSVFLLYSFISAIIYVPLLITLGYLFHNQITPLVSTVETTRHVLFIGFIVVVGVSIVLIVKRKLFK